MQIERNISKIKKTNHWWQRKIGIFTFFNLFFRYLSLIPIYFPTKLCSSSIVSVVFSEISHFLKFDPTFSFFSFVNQSHYLLFQVFFIFFLIVTYDIQILYYMYLLYLYHFFFTSFIPSHSLSFSLSFFLLLLLYSHWQQTI